MPQIVTGIHHSDMVKCGLRPGPGPVGLWLSPLRIRWLWLGWLGGTAQGDIARGLGYFSMGAGIYNVDTAIARSINVDTMIRWNQYVYLSQQEATRQYFARRNAALAKDKNAYETLMRRIQESPTAYEVENGDALERRAQPALGSSNSSLGIAIGRNAHPGQVYTRPPF